MNEGLLFLIQTLFTLYIMAVTMRIWLQLARADYFNPLSQFVVKITDPILRPLHRLIPSPGRLDLAALLLALVLSMIAIYIRASMMGVNADIMVLIVAGVQFFIGTVLQLMFWIIFIRAILSWFSSGSNPLELVMHQLTEPVLRPVRRIIPPIGGLDLSVIVVLLVIQFLRIWIGF
ncbi:hypothetical protein CWE12_11920 [Aliidiomarina sedimenti]|uniref:YggT family protein n=1 Tax=Aliidiomarina sedimenti TaxID=1933879 RepID=A0ABY0BXS8_9GAMM|nr:YggT family protein [Aliidiomarina sedimenti]RUO28985.1 hypothetical protein CWE12_11920 [Aliidiomarina sedimenti]